MDPGDSSEAVEQFFGEGAFVEVVASIEFVEEVIIKRKVRGRKWIVVMVKEGGGRVEARDFFGECFEDTW